MRAGRKKAAASRSNLPNSRMDQSRLIHMVEQIARNFAVHGEEAAAVATAKHLTDFWEPRMKAALTACPLDIFSPIARKAVTLLQQGR